ncbi:inorganic phosphate transporter [Mixta calida]|uniref:inorganic phosphate transporter n=1 Tax=Mixta calida TaxID=665913 RepID=UPI00403AAE42
MSDHGASARYTTRFPTLYPTPSGRRQRLSLLLLGLLSIVGISWMMTQLAADIDYATGGAPSFLTALLLCSALLLALGFIFINGMHDTANAVTTVIYTGTLSPARAVLISAVANMLGVLLASGVVAWGVMSLLPPEGLIALDARHGYALIYALLLAAIVWNFASWYVAIPSSSSHALLGAMLGVGAASSLLNNQGALTGIDWRQASWAGWALLLSPLLGFLAAGLLLRLMKALLPHSLAVSVASERRPPLWLRGMLILTSSGVSFAHGANDGQKGMGLMMVILLVALPGAFALNRTLPERELASLTLLTAQAQAQLPQRAGLSLTAAQAILDNYRQREGARDGVLPALGTMTASLHRQLDGIKNLSDLPPTETTTLRLRMTLTADALQRLLEDENPLSASQRALLSSLAAQLNHASSLIPWWVKIVVALALGLGTLTGWQRIAITIGERTGKAPLTPMQGASSELVTMTTLGVAEQFGLPISTTQVLTCGVAGSMVASRSALQWRTLKRMGLVWLLTLPVCALLSALLYTLFISL